MNSKSKVYFFFPGGRFALANRSGLKSFVEKLFKSEKKQISLVNYVFCNDRSIRKINKQYLGHDYATDIITFDLSESEIHRVIFHGALHLCGYRDKNTMEIKKMRGKEDLYLKKYGVSPI